MFKRRTNLLGSKDLVEAIQSTLLSLQPLSKLLYFFAWCTLFKYAMFHFYSCLKPILVDLRNLFLLSTPVTPRWVNRDQKCEIVIHIFISRLTILTRFSPSSHYVQEATFYTLIWFELNSISICLCKDPNVIFHSNGLVVY